MGECPCIDVFARSASLVLGASAAQRLRVRRHGALVGRAVLPLVVRLARLPRLRRGGERAAAAADDADDDDDDDDDDAGCAQHAATGEPAWCGHLWCLVATANCTRNSAASGFFEAARWGGRELRYSYETCGYVDEYSQTLIRPLRRAAARRRGGALRIGIPVTQARRGRW